MIDTKEWRKLLIRISAKTTVIPYTKKDVVSMVDSCLCEIDRLRAELDRYRWHPYPQEKPESGGWWQVTVCNGYGFEVIDCHYTLETDSWGLKEYLEVNGYDGIVVAYRNLPYPYEPNWEAMPEAYKPEVK